MKVKILNTLYNLFLLYNTFMSIIVSVKNMLKGLNSSFESANFDFEMSFRVD